MGGVAAGLVAGWLVLALLATAGGAWTLHLLRRPQPWPLATPPVLVVVPVRGAGPLLPGFLAGLAAQDWPDWRVAFAVEAVADPAHPVLAAFVATHPGRATLVVAGLAERRGQKVQNLLAALAALRPGDAALVTLDADILPPSDLLRELLRPVLTGQAEIASGYRWSLAAPGAGWAATALALVEAGFATTPRCAGCNLAWGGATAIGRAALDRLDLPRLWDRALSDDLMLTRAAGRAIYAPLTVRSPAPMTLDARAVMEFGTRQYRLLRLHVPRAWVLAGVAASLPPLGAAAALVAAPGDPLALGCLGLLLALHGVRIRLRRAVARAVLPPDQAALALRGAILAPVAALLNLLAWVASAVGRDITWAGRRYRLDAAGRVTLISRA